MSKMMKNFKQNILLFSGVFLMLAGIVFFFVVKQIKTEETNQKETQNDFVYRKVEKPKTPEFIRGEELFMSDCNVCHRKMGILNTAAMTNGIIEEMDTDYFKLFITKQDSLVAVKDVYTIRSKEEFGNRANVHNFTYTNTEMNDLLTYIQNE